MNNQNLILLLISVITWVVYIGYVVVRYGCQPSISDTYKLHKFKPTLWLVLIIGITPLMIVGDSIYMVFSGFGGWMVATTPVFWTKTKEGKRDKEGVIHRIGALFMITMMLLSFWLDFNLLYISTVFIVLSTALIIISKRPIWWIEIIAICFTWYVLYNYKI